MHPSTMLICTTIYLSTQHPSALCMQRPACSLCSNCSIDPQHFNTLIEIPGTGSGTLSRCLVNSLYF